MKKHIIISFLCILTLSKNGFAQLPALVAKTEKAIFQILIYNEYGVNLVMGTGFFIDNKGTGLTALHVLEDAKFAFIKDSKGKITRITEVTKVNREADIAEFNIENSGSSFPFIPLSNTLPEKGTNVFAIGNPEGNENTVSTGIISGLKKENNITIIQTTTPISCGSSGGPLINMLGQAIGVISYYQTSGQNLNFAYSVMNRKKLIPDRTFELMNDLNENFYFLNEQCKTEPNLNLTSIEFSDTSTVLNFTFTNISIAFGNGAYIYCNTEEEDKTFFLKDKNSSNKYFAISSTLSKTIEDAPSMKMGQLAYFKITFAPIKNLSIFDLKEGMMGGDWSFNNIRIPQKQKMTSKFFENFVSSQFYSSALTIKKENFEEAKNQLDELRDTISNNEKLERLSAMVNYSLEMYKEAKFYLEKAIKIDSTHSSSYADLYEVNMKMGNTKEAIKNINKAIDLNEEYIDYFYMRAEAYYKMQNWKESIADYDKYLGSDRNQAASIYLARGIAKAMINDNGACVDLQKAKDLAESDREWEKINKEYRKYCNQQVNPQ